jgi:O-antigen/teichoic acid export membrane protein
MIKLLLLHFNRISKKGLIKVFSFTAISTFVRMLTGFISVKVVALVIGPGGIALLGQLSNFSSIVMTLSSGGINNGITKFVAEYKESPGKLRLVLRAGLQITITLSMIIGVVLILFAKFFSKLILFDASYSYVFSLFGSTLMLYTLNGYLMSILNGYKEFEKFVKISITTSIIGGGVSVGLVYFWELKGALISAVTHQSIAFFITLLMIRNSPWFDFKNINIPFSKVVLKKYLNYSLMAIVSAATIPLSQLFIRGFVIDKLSVTEAGWWEGMNRISGMYLMIITSSFGVYYLPRLSEIKDKNELREEIFTAFKVILPIMIFCFLGIYFFRDLIIKILFTPDFYPMRDLFGWQLLGDFFKISAWLIGMTFIAKSLTILYIFNEIFFSLLFVALSILFLKNNGIIGVSIAYTVDYIVGLFFMIIVFNKVIVK